MPFKSSGEGDRTGRGIVVIAVLVVMLIAACLLSLGLGPTGVGLADLWSYVTGHGDALSVQERVILEAVRLPRTALGLVVGAGLAVSGAMMQGLFRNPLADPGIVGVTTGASLFAIMAIVLGNGILAPVSFWLGPEFLPLMAFCGGLINTWILYAISTRQGQTSTTTLILSGIAISALSMALIGLLVTMADDRQLRDITFWQLGSLGGATMPRVWSVLPFTLSVIVIMPFVARGLDALMLGDAAAYHMGIPVQKLKRVVIVAVAAACGATVAVTGSIGFVGIIVPHLLRIAMGPPHRFLLPGSALGGGVLLLVADSVARTIAAPAELPIGVVTALFGAPVFLFLLIGRNSGTRDMG